MCIRSTHAFITSIGHGAPAITPVRRLERSNRSNSGWASSAMNIVGTPYSAVQRSASIVSRTWVGSNASAGITIVAPWVVQPRLPITIPKQW